MDQATKDFFIRISEKLDLVHERIDAGQKELNDLKVTAVKHELNLQEHMKRSAAAEERLDKFEDEVKPLLEGMKFLKTTAKIGAFLAGVGAAIFKLIKLGG